MLLRCSDTSGRRYEFDTFNLIYWAKDLQGNWEIKDNTGEKFKMEKLETEKGIIPLKGE